MSFLCNLTSPSPISSVQSFPFPHLPLLPQLQLSFSLPSSVKNQLWVSGPSFDRAMQRLDELSCRAKADACGATLLAKNTRRNYKMEYDPDPVEELTAGIQPRIEDMGEEECLDCEREEKDE